MTFPGVRSERGIAIVAALWASAIFAVIVLSVMQIVRADATVGRGRTDVAELGAAADAAVNITILSLLGPRATQPPVNGVPFTVPFAGYTARVTVLDEAGKIDLNMANIATLNQLLINAGLDTNAAAGVAASINAWRGTRSGSDNNNENVGHSALFQSVAELELVPGVTRELYQRMAPLLTVYSQTQGIDPAFSTLDVLNVYRTTDSNAEAAWRRLEEVRAGIRTAPPSPGVAIGHAFTITAVAEGSASARAVRTTTIRLTGQAAAPLMIYRWN
jgi:general secretion pathway protein K